MNETKLQPLEGQTHVRSFLHCLRCHEKHYITLPVSVDDFCRKIDAFITLHRDCKEQKP